MMGSGVDAAERISLLLIEDDESHVALIERAFESWQSLFDLSVVHTLQEAYALLSPVIRPTSI
jgi:ActR/RegA family two-component response regulator